MGIKNWIKAVSASAIVSLAIGGTALADQIVVPSSCGTGPCETTEGNWGTNQPFGVYLSTTGYVEYQQVYASSDFAAIGSKMTITQITFRPNVSGNFSPAGYPFSAVLLDDVTIEFSTTSKDPGALGTTLVEGSLAGNENVGPDGTRVYSGPLTLFSNYAGSATGPKEFDVVIDLQTPFLYDPAAGNLLLYVRKVTGGSLSTFDAVRDSGTTSRIFYNPAAINPVITTPANSGLVTRFTVTPVPTEPPPQEDPPPPPPEPPPSSDLQVSAAVKPGSKTQVNPKSRGTTPVAIFGTASFDAGTVDPKTVTINGAPAKTKPNGEPMASLEDVDGNGTRDLLVHIDTQALLTSVAGSSAGTGIMALSAAAPGSGTAEAVLEGKTYDGTPIQGTVSFQVVK